MNKCDYGRRFKELYEYECNLRQKEHQASKRTHEFNKNFKTLKTKRAAQDKEIKRFTEMADELKIKNEKLQALNKLYHTRLQKHQQMLIYLEKNHAAKLPELIQDLECNLKAMNSFYCYQSQSKIFFNERKLPKLIQGLTVTTKDNSYQFRPFRIDPQQHTHEEVLEFLWGQVHTSGSYKEHWENLIFGDFR